VLNAWEGRFEQELVENLNVNVYLGELGADGRTILVLLVGSDVINVIYLARDGASGWLL
jgi:hypothetical protein